MATRALMTADEFAEMTTADTENYELVDGELVPLSSPTPLHSIIRDRAVRLLGNYFDQNPIGGALSETDCRINMDTVRRPDLSGLLDSSWGQLDVGKIPVPHPPDIAVEVLSSSEHAMDVTRKVRDYLSAGSREVWLLDPENGEVQVRTKSGIRLLEGDHALESVLLPGFSVSVANLLKGRD